MTGFDVAMAVEVRIEVEDESVFLRCIENHNDEGEPQPDIRGGSGWRNIYYDITSREGVLEHLAYNAIANGVEDASRLDGWADLEPGAITMRVQHAALDWVGA